MKRFILTLLTAVAPLIASAQEAPDALVKRVSDELLQLVRTDKQLASGDQRKVVEVAEAKVLPHFDFERMTRLAVGRNWAQASAEQKQSLVKEFRTMLVRTYSSSLSAYRNQTIEVKPTKMAAADKDVTVRTAVIQQGGPPIPIDYAMEKAAEGGWKVYDVIIDGVSLVTTYRGSFNDQIQKGGIDGLVKTLADRNRSPEAPKAPAPAKK
ncbi:MAG TPA: ABC transporter substrate-binding protein [Usitatibacter sp.]|nr:ABC transporter substrate-binding protein [Usitatibacter sp.]